MNLLLCQAGDREVGGMRGDEERQAGFIVMTTLKDVVPEDHPLRAIRTMVDAALEQMSPELEALHASGGRASIAPEYLLRAQLVQILYATPSDRTSGANRHLRPSAMTFCLLKAFS